MNVDERYITFKSQAVKRVCSYANKQAYAVCLDRQTGHMEHTTIRCESSKQNFSLYTSKLIVSQGSEVYHR